MKSSSAWALLALLTACSSSSTPEPPITEPAACSATAPRGSCASGLTCRAGECLAATLFCSTDRPSGLCPDVAHACLDGACVPSVELCSSTRPAGLCSGALLCRNGACSTDAPCSTTEPQGFCSAGETCVSGTCTAASTVCSPANPTGTCPSGETCTSGACVPVTPPTTTCSATQPTGACPSGQTCAGGTCVASGAPAACTNGVLDNLESDVDCGGPRCAPCGEGALCTAPTDCRTLACQTTCQPGVPRAQRDEDFESRDFSRFPWSLSSSSVAPHLFEVVVAAECHGGSACARNSVFQQGGETSAMTLPLSVRADGVVRFWVKTETEDGEHVLTFSVDDVEAFRLSGQHDWQLVEVPVTATGPGGADRRLTWSYARSGFVHPDHPPRNAVWIDDIDLPAFNTQPTIPALLSPGNGMVITDDRPELRWRSSDPDFDRIIYEVEVDTDPAFSAPTTTGETFQLTHRVAAALVDGRAYYWRARSKDESDYRWSAWSPVSSFRFLKTDEYGYRWRQATAAEFGLSQLDGVAYSDAALRVSDVPFSAAVDARPDQLETRAELTGLPPARAGSPITVTYTGGVDSTVLCDSCNRDPYAQIDVSLDGAAASGRFNIGTVPSCDCTSVQGSTTILDAASLVADGGLSMVVRANYTNVCGATRTFMCGSTRLTVSYPSATAGTITSVPIYLDTFGGAPNWEKVAFHGDGDVRVTVLDQDRQPIPDREIPGNSAGLEPGTHLLFGLAPGRAVIHLRAQLGTNGTLTDWEAYANDGYRFHFGNDGDFEGWTPTLGGADLDLGAVRDGVLRLEAPVEGRDLRLDYRLPLEVDAARFRTLIVRLRTSNNSGDDRVTISWENNFGLVDPVRSFSTTDFLFELQDVGFDLTQAPAAGQQPWQGRVRALRVYPVERFFDAASMASAGWVEVDSIWVR